tara:strand:+ start:428 stop:1363 length:936 start_codon:yes stop_codon:yes gene_type:complete
VAVFAGQNKDYKGNYSNRPSGTTGPGSGYTPGGNSFQNYSQKDQNIMFNQAGGKDKFIEMAGNLQQKYPRGLDYQKYLDKSKQYFAGQSIGGKEVMGPDGIMRLQMSGADVPMKDAFGRTILSMQTPSLTAQAPTLGQLVGDMGRGIGSMMGAGTDFILGGGTLGRVLGGFKDKFTQGKNFMGGIMNPGDISGKLQAAGPEAQRMYTQFMQQPGMTYQKAFEMATGTPFSANTISNEPMTINNMMQTSESINNLTEFGQALANRIREDRPNISEADLLEALQRSNRAGFASQGRAIFNTGLYAMGGIANLN